MSLVDAGLSGRLTPYMFVLPAVVLFIGYVAYPIIYVVSSSIYSWDGINGANYVGLSNYRRMFTNDPAFWLAIRNAIYWAPLTILPQMLLGFAIAYMLETGVPRQAIFQAIFYLPAIISPVVVGIVWQRIYNPFGGLLSDIGISTGMHFLSMPFLSNTKTAVFAVIAVNVWQWTGFSMLLYVAGLKGLSSEIVEAARLDGASTMQSIIYVVWPMLKHVHLTLVLLGVIGTLQTFPLIYMLTNGGPNHATESLPNYIFLQAFRLQSMGYSAAISVVLMGAALLLSVFQVGVLGSRFALAE
jgi:raffinose/stachyose/melibiose transport system permease protein